MLIFIYNRVKLIVLVRGLLYKFVYFLVFFSITIISSDIKINGEVTNLKHSDFFISLKLNNSISILELKKELSSIKYLPKILEIKQFNKNSFVVKFKNKLTKEDIGFLNENYYLLDSYVFDDKSWPIIISDKINIKFKENIDDVKKDRILSLFKLKIVKNYNFNKNIYSLQSSENIIKLSTKLYETGLFHYAYPDFYTLFKRKFIPNDTYYNEQWHHENSYIGISSEGAWDITKGSSDIKIAVLDDGADLNHEDLNIIISKDFTGEGFYDSGEHGTSCAGLIAAKGNNNIGVTGVCMNCSLIISKVMPSSGYNLESMIVEAFDWSLSQGADIFNNSWGFDTSVNVNNLYPMLVDSIKNILKNGRDGRGGIVIFASGNENREFLDTSLEGLDGIITVGATDYHGNRAYYSNYGNKLDFIAPSSTGFLGSDKDAIWTTDITGSLGYNDNGKAYQKTDSGREYLGLDVDNEGKYTKYFGGTSAAAPLVSGIIALILSKNDKLTKNQVYDILKSTSDKIGTGYNEEGHSNYLGYGKVNAQNALEYLNSNVNLCENIACSNHGNCIEIEGAKACNCDLGYIGNDNLECTKVIQKTPCDNITCSEHGICKVINTAPRCFCDSGYVVSDNVHCVVSYQNSKNNGCSYGEGKFENLFYFVIFIFIFFIIKNRIKI